MLVKKKNLPHSRVELTISANAHEYQHAFDAELEVAGADLKIEGFRPGKAPLAKILEKVGRERIEVAAIDHAVSEVYQHTLAQENMIPVEGPKIELTSFVVPGPDATDDTEVIVFTAEVDVLPEVVIAGYEKLKVKAPEKVEVTEEEVQTVIDELRKQRSNLIEVAEDTKAAKGMWSDLYFKGSVDGVAREDMLSEHHPVIIGEGNLIPGFEDNMIGMKKGEEKTFKIVFPKEYHAVALQNKEAEFTIRINELKDITLPELNDDFAKLLGQKDAKQLKETVKKNIEAEKQEKWQRDLEEDILQALLKVAKFEVPQSLLSQELDRLFDESKERFTRMQMNWEDYLSQIEKTELEVKEEMRDQAEKNVKIGLALGKVIQEEKIKGSDGKAMREAMDKLIAIATP